MSTITNVFSLKVWSPSRIAAFGIVAACIVAAFSALPVFSWSAAGAGLGGALVLRHFDLHGWTLVRGTASQRLVLAALWLGTVGLVGMLAHVYGQ